MFVRGIHHRRDFLARHIASGAFGARETMSGSGKDLDRLRTAPHILTNQFAHVLRTVAELILSPHFSSQPPLLMIVDAGGGADMMAAGADARAPDDAFGNRDF